MDFVIPLNGQVLNHDLQQLTRIQQNYESLGKGAITKTASAGAQQVQTPQHWGSQQEIRLSKLSYSNEMRLSGTLTWAPVVLVALSSAWHHSKALVALLARNLYEQPLEISISTNVSGSGLFSSTTFHPSKLTIFIGSFLKAARSDPCKNLAGKSRSCCCQRHTQYLVHDDIVTFFLFFRTVLRLKHPSHS